MSITFTAYVQESPKHFGFVEEAPAIQLSNSNAFKTFQKVFAEAGTDMDDYCGHIEDLDAFYLALGIMMKTETNGYCLCRYTEMFTLIEWVRDRPKLNAVIGWG